MLAALDLHLLDHSSRQGLRGGPRFLIWEDAQG